MRTFLVLLGAVLLAACSPPAVSAGEGGGPVLVNRTGKALLYVAFDLSQAGLVDPNPALDPASEPERLVAAGAEREIEISGDEGGGVVLFIYEIPAADHAGPVPLSRTVQVTREELQRAGNRIVLDPQ